MALHELPICFSCQERIGQQPVFAAMCDHDHCPSVVFHPLCLMRHRESRTEAFRERERFFETHRVVGVVVEEIED